MKRHIIIREETATDHKAVKEVNDRAFNQPLEGNIVEKLRHSDAETLSLVAELDNRVVGHIFFSPAGIEGHPEIEGGMGLAPMAVLPEYQQQGIGKMLVKKGLDILENRHTPFIIVLGHPGYYPKFGFESASKYGLKCQWPGVPDEAFMVLIPDKDKMQGIRGVARYRDEWDEAM